MERKNLFLAAMLLVGMNCPINTNTTEFMSNMAWKGTKELAYLGALGAGVAAIGVANRVMFSDPHTQNQIGSVDVKPDEIKHIEVNIKLAGRPFKGTYTWNQKNNGQAKATFIKDVITRFNISSKTSAEFSYEVSLVLNRNNQKVLLSGESKDTHISLDGGNLATKLWDNVISHYLILQSECKNGNDWKPANTLPNYNKFSVEYSTELSNSHYIHTTGSIGSMVVPIAATSYTLGVPKSLGQLGVYGGAIGTGCLLQHMWYDAGSGVDLKIPGSKEVFSSPDKDQVTRLVEDFIVDQSVIDSSDITFDAWETERDRLVKAHEAARTANAKGGIEDEIMGYANEAQIFLRTDIVTLTDKVSGLELHYAPVQTEVKTGLIKPDNICEIDELIPDLGTGDLRQRIGRLATAAGNGMSRIKGIFFGGQTRHRRRGGIRGGRTL